MRIDFARMGFRLRDIGTKRLTFGEAYDLTERLSVEWGTHTHAVLRSWSFPASFGEVNLLRLTRRTLNYWRGEDEQLIELETPWRAADYVSIEEQVEYEAKLLKRSVFGDQ